jgi:hypothetical protein
LIVKAAENGGGTHAFVQDYKADSISDVVVQMLANS